jgi:pimeloyl-ACP methyl ester carboxylesterase
MSTGRSTPPPGGPVRFMNIGTGATTPFPRTLAEQLTFSGRTIDVPVQFIAGVQDWGANRIPGGALGAGKTGFTNFKGVRMVDGAGHWPHEEQPEIVSQHLVDFLKTT